RSENMKQPSRVHRVPSSLGNVTQLCVLPDYSDGATHLACAHEKGVLSIWNTRTWEIIQVIHVSVYGITVMALSLNHYLWMGFKTGVMHVYDISKPKEWVLVKAWDAHSSSIVKLVVNDDSLTAGNTTPLLQVLSLDCQGNVAVWDGLLEEYQKDRQVQLKEVDYCNYNETSILVCSWNIDACKPETIVGDNLLKLKGWLQSMRNPDIIVVGLQEIVDLESKRQTASTRWKRDQSLLELDPSLVQAAVPQYCAWQKCITDLLNESDDVAAVYELVKSENLVGLFSLVFIRAEHVGRLKHVESAVVKTGLRVMSRSLHGNKGAVAIRFILDDTPICFVNCHLAAGQDRVEARNGDIEEILKAAKFEPVLSGTEQGDNPLDHLHCFLSGDLNYRVDVHTRDSILQLLDDDRNRARLELLKNDQLNKQRMTNPLLKLSLFEEHIINFDPTYKYNIGTDVYDSSVKQRVPAWCDRILYRNVPQPVSYGRHEVLTSDHRPISAGFVLPVRTIRKSDKDKAVLEIEKAWR
ncbi:Endonuclease/exonuclease/phosphatase, partial [Dichotomocladium elegans]